MELSGRRSLSPSDLRHFDMMSPENKSNNNSQLEVDSTEDVSDNVLPNATNTVESVHLVQLDTSVPGTPRSRKLEQISKSKVLLNERCEATVEFIADDPVQEPTTPPTASSNITVTVLANTKEELSTREITLAALEPSESYTDTKSHRVVEETKLAHSNLGPRAITISGTVAGGESSPPLSKYRKVNRAKLKPANNPQSPRYVSELTEFTKSSPRLGSSQVAESPADFISKGGFTLTDHVNKLGSYKSLEFHRPLEENVILSPFKQLTPNSDVDVRRKQFNFGPRTLNFGNLAPSSKDANEGGNNFSILQGQNALYAGHLHHPLGSCDGKVQGYAIWETEVGLPANWSSVNVDHHTFHPEGIVESVILVALVSTLV